jgi:hypothetical protein
MEALALLCTLHADGPATVKRLRNDGCSSLEQLEAYDAAHLADLLGVAPAVARRLGKEARVLRSRLGLGGAEDGLLDREEAPEPLVRATRDPLPGAAPGPSALERGDRALVARVLGRWAAEDELSRAPALPDAAPAAEPARAPRALPAGALEGLDAALAAQLAEAGVHTLPELAEVDCRALAKATGQSFPRLRRLQFLARRAPLDAPPAPAPLALEPTPAQPRAPIATPLGERPWIPASDAPLAAPTPVTGPPPTPRRFWEPREFWEERQAELHADEPPLVSEAEQVTLNWNFEIPTPPPPAPLPRPRELDDAAGPFA